MPTVSSSPTTIQTATDRTVTRARQVLACCAILERAGCSILHAHAHTPRPKIVVSQRPRLGYLQPAQKTRSPWSRTFAANFAGIQIEWTELRTRS